MLSAPVARGNWSSLQMEYLEVVSLAPVERGTDVEALGFTQDKCKQNVGGLPIQLHHCWYLLQ